MASEDYYTARELQVLTGTPASTWNYWAKYHPERGPAAIKIGRRRVWKKTVVHQWLNGLVCTCVAPSRHVHCPVHGDGRSPDYEEIVRPT